MKSPSEMYAAVKNFVFQKIVVPYRLYQITSEPQRNSEKLYSDSWQRDSLYLAPPEVRRSLQELITEKQWDDLQPFPNYGIKLTALEGMMEKKFPEKKLYDR